MTAIATTERHILFESPWLQIGHVAVRPTSSACGEIEVATHNVLALPLAGAFAKHDGPRQQVIATPQHALLIPAGQAYRLSFPGCIGDRCLVLRMADEALDRLLAESLGDEGFNPSALRMHLPLPPALAVTRTQLWHELAQGQADALQAEELALHLLMAVLDAARKPRPATSGPAGRRTAPAADASGRRLRHVRHAVALITAQPLARWTLSDLARSVNISAGHLAHSFRAELGLPIYDFVMRSRLALALDAVLDSDASLTGIALDTGFSSHSHFTARFRALFGHTPLQLRRGVQRRTARRLRAMGVPRGPLALESVPQPRLDRVPAHRATAAIPLQQIMTAQEATQA